jgi:hypothetical protein
MAVDTLLIPLETELNRIPPGGFETGNSRDIDFSPLAERSIEMAEPVLVVALNYRLNGKYSDLLY